MKEKLKELKKISWVRPKQLLTNSLMVIIFTTVMTLLIYFEDILISSLSTIIERFI